MRKGFHEVAESYSAVKGWDPVADLFKYVPEGAEVSAHAGLVRYAKEKGINVPEKVHPSGIQGKMIGRRLDANPRIRQ